MLAQGTRSGKPAQRGSAEKIHFNSARFLQKKGLVPEKEPPRIIVKVGIWHYKYKKTTGAALRLLRSLSFHLWQPGKPGLLRHFE